MNPTTLLSRREVIARLGLVLGGALIGGDIWLRGDTVAFSHGARARGRYRMTRTVEVDAYAGPAMWRGPEGTAVVPEAGAELRMEGRWSDLRVSAVHRFGRTYDVRVDGGIWRSGVVPGGGNSTLGYAASGEAGMAMGAGVRVALALTHFARIDDQSSALDRTTGGIRLGWALPNRRGE